MLVEIGQPLVDLRALRPNPAVNELLLVIGQVHHPGEVLAKPNWINDREIEPARRGDRKQPQNNIIQRPNRLLASAVAGFKQERALIRVSEAERH